MNTPAAHKFVTPISNEIENLLLRLKQQEIPYPVELQEETRKEFEQSILTTRAAQLENKLRDPFVSKEEAETLLDELAEVADKMCVAFGSAEWFNAVDEIPF